MNDQFELLKFFACELGMTLEGLDQRYAADQILWPSSTQADSRFTGFWYNASSGSAKVPISTCSRRFSHMALIQAL